MSAIDLTFIFPSLSLNYNWTPLTDLHGSDHFPILLSPNKASSDEKLPYWKLTKANWKSFQELYYRKPLPKKIPIICKIPFFSSLITIADGTIPKTSTKNNKPTKPWFNDEYKQAISDRKCALRNFTSPSY